MSRPSGDRVPQRPALMAMAPADRWTISGQLADWTVALVAALVRLLVALLCRPIATGAALLLAAAYLHYGRTVAVYAAVIAVVVLIGWSRLAPASFAAWVSIPTRSAWRGWWVYRRHWQPTMALSGLSQRFQHDEYLPVLRKVIADSAVDRVLVDLVTGQTPADFDASADALAHSFGVLACQVVAVGPGRIWLVLTRRDRLAAPIAALPIAEDVDLAALPVGLRQDTLAYPRRLDPVRRLLGRVVADAGHALWTVRLIGTHVLIAGATGAGKGSVLWSLIRALVPAVRSGLVQLWVVDPKGGMELAAGRPLFARFCFGDDTTDDPDHKRARELVYAEFLEDAVAIMHQRQAALRGVTRLHHPTPGDPLIVLVLDELASLTAYVIDRDAKKRIAAALALLLSQGRAAGVLVVAAVQDPRKEVVPDRGLFPTRIALRLAEASEVDLVLGPGARDRGAACHEIPDSTPGIGYVVIDGVREPARVRAAYVSDDDIAQMSQEPPAAPAPPLFGDVA